MVSQRTSGTPSNSSTVDGDLDYIARRQQAIRFGQAGVVVLIAFALIAFLSLARKLLSGTQLTLVLITALAFAVWSVWGTRRIHEYFQQGYWANKPPTQLLGQSRWEAVAHLSGLYVLILLLYWIAVDVGELRFLWLFLLVPVGHAALFLPMWATGLTYGASACILVWAVGAVYGLNAVMVAVMQFSLAAAFVFVFAQIAVSAEMGRAEVALLVAELTTLNRQLSQYSVQAEELAVTRERNELARNIHDSVGHVLTAVNIQLRAAQALIHQDVASANEAIGRAQELAVSGLADIRSSVSALRASPLDGRSLSEAIRALLSSDSSLGLQTSFTVHGEPRGLPHAVALALYRATQEGLTNVLKHTEAAHVEVELDYREKDTVGLTVTDDGKGSETLSGGFGLVGLRERAELLGGDLSVNSIPTGGIKLRMRLPG